MKILLALRDVRTGSFLAPLTATTPGEAERTYLEILGQQGTLIAKHPSDFPLYEIGKYDEFTGEVFPLQSVDGKVLAPRLLIDAAQLNLLKEG